MDVSRATILARAERVKLLRELHAMDKLKALGHSAMKAAEIHLDAVRGDRYALGWIKAALEHKETTNVA